MDDKKTGILWLAISGQSISVCPGKKGKSSGDLFKHLYKLIPGIFDIEAPTKHYPFQFLFYLQLTEKVMEEISLKIQPVNPK